MTGLLYGFFTFGFMWMPIGCVVFFSLLELSGVEKAGDYTIFSVLGFVLIFLLPFIAAFKTATLANNEVNNRLTATEYVKWGKLKKFIYSYFLTGLLLILISSNGGLEGITFLEENDLGVGLAFATPLFIAIILTFLVPLINIRVKKFLSKRKQIKKSNSNHYKPATTISSSGNWFKDKIVAPVIVGVVVGFISFLITGQFSTGGEIGLISIPITLVFNSNS